MEKVKTVPLYKITEIGKRISTDKVTECPFDGSDETYAFIVEGSKDMPSAMNTIYGRSYPVGSTVFVDPTQANAVQHNDVVAAMLLDEDAFTFRVLLRDNGRDTLMPLNPQFPNLDPSRQFKIIGKVIGSVTQ